MKAIKRADDSDLAAAAHMDLELIPGEVEKPEEEEAEQQKLKRASNIARALCIFLTIALLVLWPMPMLGSNYVFSKSFFTGWVSFNILWLFCSAFCVILYPLWEGRKTSTHTFKSIFLDITGKRKPTMHGRATMSDEFEPEKKGDAKGVDTPPEKAVEG